MACHFQSDIGIFSSEPTTSFLSEPDLNPVTPSVYGFCPLNQQLFIVKVYQSCQCLFLVVNRTWKIGPVTWKMSMFHIMFLFIYQVMIFFLWDVKGAREDEGRLEDDYPLENEWCKLTIQVPLLMTIPFNNNWVGRYAGHNQWNLHLDPDSIPPLEALQKLPLPTKYGLIMILERITPQKRTQNLVKWWLWWSAKNSENLLPSLLLAWLSLDTH